MQETIYEINEFGLDKEWKKQSQLFFKQAAQLAEAKRELESAKRALKVTEADMSKKIRQNPNNYGIEKVTEKALEEARELTTEIEEANQRVIEAKYNVEMLDASVTALDHKKKALENLVYLHTQNYYSEPKQTGANEHFNNEQKDRVRKRVKRKNVE